MVRVSAGILGECDGVMVARGDLGVEMPPEEAWSSKGLARPDIAEEFWRAFVTARMRSWYRMIMHDELRMILAYYDSFLDASDTIHIMMILKYISLWPLRSYGAHHSASWPSQSSGAAYSFLQPQQVPWVQKQIIRAANATRTEYS